MIDINRIMENHTRFKSERERMKADFEQVKAKMQQEREAIAKLTENLQEYRKGTREYKELEETVAKRSADLQVQLQLKNNEFQQREAKTYYEVYQEILQATDYFCKQHAIDMVVRYNGTPVDVEQPNSVLSYISRPVVWNDPGLDITDMILQDLNRSAAPSTANPNAVPARPGVPFKR